METTAAFLLVAALVIVSAAVVILRRRRPSASADASSDIARLSVRIQEREREVEQVRGERDEARRERDSVRQDLGTAQTELAALKADHEARSEELAKARSELDNQFKGLAAGVLKESTETLLKQAEAQFHNQRQLGVADLEQRKEAIDNMVAPIRESLARLGEHAADIEKRRVGAYEGLTSQIASLQKVAGSLSEALRSPNIRGQWAEQELGNILELSGLHQHISYFPQQSVPAPGGTVRPDAIVSVPGGVKVVIDAKAPLENYLKAHEAGGGEERQLLTSHAAAISNHAKDLGRKDYADVVAGSPDFVLMFVPADPILDSAMKVDPTLWEQAWRQHRVLIATPGLLLAFLRTVALAWQQQDVQQNAQKIADLGKDLYGRLRVFAEHLDDMGAGLGKALVAYNRGIGSLEGRVLPQARRFEDLNVASDLKRVPELSPVEGTIRSVADRQDHDTNDDANENAGAEPPNTLLPRTLSA